MEKIIIKNLKKSYKKSLLNPKKVKIVFDNLNMEIPLKSMTAITGKNGSGKTTLFKILASHIDYDEGNIEISSLNLKEYLKRHRIFLVTPESRSMYHRLTVSQNLDFFLKIMKVKKTNKEIDELLDYFEIRHLKNTVFYELSTGLRQRAIITRGLLLNPDIILIDEPEIGLDTDITIKLFNKLKQLKHDMTIIYSSHRNELTEKADKTIKLEN